MTVQGPAEHGWVADAFQRPLGSGSQARLTRSVKRHAEEFHTATLSRSKGRALACVHSVCQNLEVLRQADAYPHNPYAGVRTHVKVVVGVYGVYALLAQWHHDQLTRPRDHVTEKFLGKSPMESKQLFYEASLLTYTTIDNNHTAFLVVWGTDDDIVDPRSQLEVFVTVLKEAGFFVRTVIIPGVPHFWMREAIDEPASYAGFVAPRLVRFLQARL